MTDDRFSPFETQIDRDRALLSWPGVEAEAVGAEVVTSRSSVGNRPSTVVYDVQVAFRYDVDGRRYESRTTSGLSSSSRSRGARMSRQARSSRKLGSSPA